MENTPYLYDTLVRVLSQHAHWLDFRHQKRREAPAFMPGMDRRWARRAQCPRAQQDLRSTRALNGRGHCIGGSPGIHAGEDVPVPLWAYPSHYTWALASGEILAASRVRVCVCLLSVESVRGFPSSCLTCDAAFRMSLSA